MIDQTRARTSIRGGETVGQHWIEPAVVIVVAFLYYLFPNARLDFSRFDQHDAESYLALSRALVSGLGYTRNLIPAEYIPHTTWPPGVPLLLAPFVALAGWPIDYLVVKLGTITYGMAGIILAHLYSRRLSALSSTRIAVVLMLALNPFYWQFSRMTNAEMPTIVWALLSLYLVDLFWSRRDPHPVIAAMIGLVCGYGMLIRGSFFGVALLPLARILAARAGDRPPLRSNLLQAGAGYLPYLAGFCLPFLGWMLRNSTIDASKIGYEGINQVAMILRVDPIDPQSPFRSGFEIAAQALDNFRYHIIYDFPESIVPGLWSRRVWTDLGHFAAPLALALSAGLVLFSLSARRNLPTALIYGSMAALNLFYAYGAFERFWVPVSCLVAITLPVSLETWSRLPLRRPFAPVLLAAYVASLAGYIVRHERSPYRDPDYADLAALLQQIHATGVPSGPVYAADADAFALETGGTAPMTMAGLGIVPDYRYAILRDAEWNQQRLPGNPLLTVGSWHLIALKTPEPETAIEAAMQPSADSQSNPIRSSDSRAPEARLVK